MRVCVIGAGASGLSCIKNCLDNGFDPVCYETEDVLGGLWHYTDDETHSSVYKSTVINTSKEMMCFTDFPIPKKYPPFMHHKQIIEYFNLYADTFNLRSKINFKTRVEKVSRADDYPSTGRMQVDLLNMETQEKRTEIFDAVMVCSGHHWKPNKPTFKGQEKFKGRILHSHAYKDPKEFEGKNVVVVGVGNSGVDVAVEVSRVGQVHLSTRSGTWLANRIFGGIPADFLANTRYPYLLGDTFRENLSKILLFLMNGNIKDYGLGPSHGPLAAHPTINGELLGRIAVSAVVVKPNIAEFTEDGVVYSDGTTAKVDAVVLATGYEISFPFIDPKTTGFSVKDNEVNLYKYIFPPPPKEEKGERRGKEEKGEGERRGKEEKYWPSLAFVGLIQPWGAIMPISEMQGRWAIQVFKGNAKLPSGAEMWRDIEKKREEMGKRYVKSPRHTIQVDYISYMDELASLQGCYPSFWKLFFKFSPSLALRSLFGPSVPPFYRLLGPGKWEGASKAIDDLWERNFYPTRTRSTQKIKEVSSSPVFKKLVLLLLVLVFVRVWRASRL